MLANGAVKIQAGAENRVTVEGGVLTVSMLPGDLDGNGGKANGLRQRTEIRVHDPKLSAAAGETATWGCMFRINELVDWTKTFYHIMQIKTEEISSPVFTVSIRDKQVSARSYGADYRPITTVCSAVGVWIPLTVTVTNKTGSTIEYNIAGQKGLFSFPTDAELPTPQTTNDMVYFKAGQYRDITAGNPIPSKTSTSYKGISCAKK